MLLSALKETLSPQRDHHQHGQGIRGRCLATEGGPTQLTESVWPRPVSVAAGSQRHERAGWNGSAPLPPLLAAGSNALAPYGRGKGRDTPRHRAALTPAASGLAIAVALAVVRGR